MVSLSDPAIIICCFSVKTQGLHFQVLVYTERLGKRLATLHTNNIITVTTNSPLSGAFKTRYVYYWDAGISNT